MRQAPSLGSSGEPAAGVCSQLPPLQFLQLALANPFRRAFSVLIALLLLLRVLCRRPQTLRAVAGGVCLCQQPANRHTFTMQCRRNRVDRAPHLRNGLRLPQLRLLL